MSFHICKTFGLLVRNAYPHPSQRSLILSHFQLSTGVPSWWSISALCHRTRRNSLSHRLLLPEHDSTILQCFRPQGTCSEFKDLSSEGAQSIKRWMKENKAQAYPKCGTTIQKSYGYNHMQCFNCSIHFC